MNRKLYLLLIKRIINSLVVLFFIVSFLFILLRISPGDPSTKFIGPGLSHQLAEKVRESFEFNSSILVQYISFIKNFLMLDMGYSYTFKMPVIDIIFQYLPFTMVFSLICIFIQICSSLLLIIITYRIKYLDKYISKLFLAAYSVPVFIIGIALLYIFSFKLNLFPSSGVQTIGGFNSIIDSTFDLIKHLVLPVTTLSIPGTAMFYIYLRENTGSISDKTYILFLRSMGLTENEILRKHIIPNTIIPMISIAGIELGLLFSGAVITEIIFGLPGLGRLAMDAILSRDYPLIIGCSFMSGLLIMFTNLMADYIKYRTDKRLVKEILS